MSYFDSRQDDAFDPVLHYLEEGWHKGFDPNPDFSTQAYLRDNEDVAAAHINPLVHWIKVGREDGRPVQPSAHRAGETPAAEPARPARTIGSPSDIEEHFDATFYRTAYPEVADSDLDPLTHYWTVGWLKGYDPNPDFSTAFYLKAYADVASSNFNPFWHYVRIGAREGRAATPAPASAAPAAEPRPGPHVPAKRVVGKPGDLKDHFDAAFYLATYPEVVDSGISPLTHYWTVGWTKGYDPSPDFSTAFYLNSNPDVAGSNFNPFWHYVKMGATEGRSARPSGAGRPAADKAAAAPAEPRPAKRIVGKPADLEGYFDKAFYLATYPDVADSGMDPLMHYWTVGWTRDYDPSPGFSTAFYLASNPDVAGSNFNPFWHYVRIGRQEQRPARPPAPEAAAPADPAPALENAAPARADAPAPKAPPTPAAPPVSGNMADVAPHFDADFYFATYPEAADSGLDPLTHYWTVGWAEGRNPNAEFSTDFYLKTYKDIARSGVHPFWHYVVAGKAEGRLAAAPVRAAATDRSGNIDDVRRDFDPIFYRSRYPDIAAAEVDPLMHYWTVGWKEGRDPCSNFSTSFYLENNPDIADAKLNPFWHYIVAGRAEGRVARHPGGPRIDRLRTIVSLEDEARRWRNAQKVGPLTPVRRLTADLEAALGSRTRLILSVGHDHYRRISGGVQLCIHREEALAVESGAAYLNIHPAIALPRLAHLDDDPDPAVRVLVDGRDVATCRISALVAAARKLRLTDVDIVIHQMLGHAPERIVELARALGRQDCFLWLHDFFTICTSFTLQRNTVAYCDAPPLASNACTLCRYGPERAAQLERIEAFFSQMKVHVLSPSEVALAIWRRNATVTPASARVLSHMELTFAPRTEPAPAEADKPTIAFLGTPAPHKGWDLFEGLVRRHINTDRYRFVFFGSAAVPAGGIDHVKVHVDAQNRDAMIEAIAATKVDLVIHFASWPETFSLSTYEALAGGAYVVTNPISGNVAATVERLGRGAILKDAAELYAFFDDGRAEALAAAARADRRQHTVRHTLSGMVHDILNERAGSPAP
ncbi:glycosyltransferase family protein [Acuticoccus sediminis]|uniref:hypothetical protein n=1 Tax=Acuticoccus sediminis TaxID=2184697 RepID=UPI001CFCD4CE|nr:hypothetical protein [Acuticoccus sediminis]